jgi:MFS transporter, PPP family, 3-phenylpropionic acid transporter
MPNIARVTIFIMFVHLSLGAIMPYLPVWLGETKGLSGAQIGVILASSSFGRIIVGPLAAAWAEGRKDSRTPLVVFALTVALGYVAYPFMDAFWPIALTCFVVGMLGQCLVASSEATTLHVTAGSTFWPYGRARAIASTGFAFASLGAGAALQAYGIDALYAWFVLATFGTFFCALWLKPDRVAARPHKPLLDRLKGGIGLFGERRFLVCVIAAGLIQAAHAFYYGFSSTLWLAQGFTGTQVGLLWALGVGVEVLFLAFLAGRLTHIRPEMMILIGGIGAVIRWGTMSFGLDLAPSFALQVFHALTFATTHIGFMRLIEREIKPDQRATGQQLSSSLIMSPLMGLASISAGWLYDHYQGGGYWSGFGLALAGVMLVGAVMVARSSCRTSQARS